MICSACGTENENGFKFCVKCGSNMENPSEVNYEAVDRGHYHSEDETPENAGGFTMNEETFVIRDVPAPAPKKQLYTSDELNSSEEEFDFSMFDEPSMASLPTPPVPPQPVQPMAKPNMQSAMPQMPQPMQQPMMYGQPQIIGYDQSGMPIYGQPQIQQPMGGIPMQGIPAIPPQNTPKAEEPKKDDKQAFWDFFDEGNKKPADHSKSTNDFFGKIETESKTPEDPFADIDNRRKKRLQGQSKSDGVMGDMPVVDGSKLEKNDSSRINNLYMRQIKDSVSDDLTVGTGKSNSGAMEETREVDASLLAENLNVKSRISMGYTDDVNADDIKQAVNDHKEAIMAKADHAVEAMPKKINPYESELDKIELPEYMQSKKTVHENSAEIPSLPALAASPICPAAPIRICGHCRADFCRKAKPLRRPRPGSTAKIRRKQPFSP